MDDGLAASLTAMLGNIRMITSPIADLAPAPTPATPAGAPFPDSDFAGLRWQDYYSQAMTDATNGSGGGSWTALCLNEWA
jgi:hypothetical protein